MSRMDPEMITLTQASHVLELSVVQTRRLADRGDLDMVRTPLGRVVSRDSVFRLAESRKNSRKNKGREKS